MLEKEPWFDKIINFLVKIDLPSKAQVFLIGSRARKDNLSTADIDLGFLNIEEFKLQKLDEEIENLNLPLNVDLVNLDKVNKKFYNKALEEGKLLFERP